MIQEVLLFFGFLFGSAEDIRIREVPDTLNYFLLGSGILLGTYEAITGSTFTPVLHTFYGILAAFIIGSALYYTGQWGGGDAKMLLGVGAIMQLDFSQGFPGFFDFMLSFIIAGSFLGLAWLLYLFYQQRNELSEELKPLKEDLWMYVLPFFLLVGAVAYGVLIVDVAVILIGLLSMMFLFIVFALQAVRLAEDILFLQQKEVQDLVPGDWLAEDVEEVGVKVRPEGLSEEDIEKLKTSDIRSVTVKEGMPFVPSFLIGYIIYLLIPPSLILFLL